MHLRMRIIFVIAFVAACLAAIAPLYGQNRGSITGTLRDATGAVLPNAVNPDAICAFMKTITLDNIINAMEKMSPQVTVPAEIALKAKRSIDRMLELV